MRIHRIEIGKYKNLNDFVIEFDKGELAAVLIGENGAGKSNLIEAIVHIFRSLDLDQDTPPPFKYEIRYQCRGMTIGLRADPNRARQRQYEIEVVHVDGHKEQLSWAKFFKQRNHFLPAYIFAYYSGPSRRLEQLFKQHRDRWDLALGRDEEMPRSLPRLFYCKPDHSRLALLTYFIQGKAGPGFLQRFFQVDAFDSAMLVLGKPRAVRDANDRFWGVGGRVGVFLDQIWTNTLAPMRFGAGEPFVYCYFPDIESMSALQEAVGEDLISKVIEPRRTSLQVFSKLDALLSYGMLRDLQIRVRSGGASVPFAELSEGEQQFLTVVGLLRFTQEQESLFLLDEPDTHLNPRWKLEYLMQLRENAGTDDSSQIILSTHDPLTIADLKATQVHIFSRANEGDGRVKADQPFEDPRGLGITGLLTEMFGLPTTLDPTTQGKIRERDALAAKGEKLSDDERLKLQQLSFELGSMGFLNEHRNPAERQFFTLLQQWQKKQRKHFSQISVAEQQAIAEEIFNELRRDGLLT